MIPRIATAATLACLVLCGCGGDQATERSDAPPAQKLSSSICSPVSYGGPGRPQLLIVSHSVFQGPYKGHGVQNAQAIKMVLAERGWRAGPYSVGMQACEEADAKTGAPSPEKCARNARAFARSRGVIGVIGPLTSSCATNMLATLNEAPDGPLAMIAGGNTYVGLTRSGPGTRRDEPERYHPTGRPSYARMAPTDDVQGAAAALHARQHKLERVFVLDDGSDYGRGLRAAFEYTADRLGLTMVGGARWTVQEHGYLPLAKRIGSARPDAVLVAGDITLDGPRLISDLAEGLGPDVQLMAGDSFNQPENIIEEAGARADGLVITIAVLPNRELPAPGRAFAAEFVRRFSQRPCCFSVHEAQATHILLDAIARSGGSRERVTEAVMSARVEGGLIGDFAIDANGDTTLNEMGIYRIDDGTLRFEGAVTPPADLLGRG
jgi:ABC-type branched-subunit amino acid transport system substrate-binding protein